MASDNRRWYCDVDDSLDINNCPTLTDPISSDPFGPTDNDVIKLRCGPGMETPTSMRMSTKCYNKDTIKGMYKQRHSIPFVEPTSRAQFTNQAIQKIQRKIGESSSSAPKTIFDLFPQSRSLAPSDEAVLRYKLTPRPDEHITPTEFMKAVIRGDLYRVKLYLRQSNGSPNIRDQNGNTPLIYASMDGNLDMAMLLAINGARISASNKLGMTPLMYASMNGNFNLVKFLKENGADPYDYTYTGQNAISMARTKKIKDYLEGKKTRAKPKRKSKTKTKRKSKSKTKTKTKNKRKSKSKSKTKKRSKK